MVNDDAPTAEARAPIPSGCSQGYHQSASTLNLLRAFTKGGFADLAPGARVEPGVRRELAARVAATRRIAAEIERALAFMAACGIDLAADAAAARGRRLDEPRGPAARLRGGADAARLADRRLVRLLRAHALDRRAHARSVTAPTSSSSPASHNPLGVQARPGRDARGGASSSASASIPGASRAG